MQFAVHCGLSFACKGKLPNLRVDCSAVVLYCVTIIWPQIFRGSLQVMAAGLLPIVTVEHRHNVPEWIALNTLAQTSFHAVWNKGRQPKARPAKSSGPKPLYQMVVNAYGQPSGIIFYESALLPHCTMNVLYVAFWAFVTKCENQELIWFVTFHKSPRFSNSKGNGIVGRRLVAPPIPCRVCFWLATRERLPTPRIKLRGL